MADDGSPHPAGCSQADLASVYEAPNFALDRNLIGENISDQAGGFAQPDATGVNIAFDRALDQGLAVQIRFEAPGALDFDQRIAGTHSNCVAQQPLSRDKGD